MLRALLLLAVFSLSACAVDPCQRRAQVDLAGKSAGCAGLDAGWFLADPAQCRPELAACSRAEQAAIVKALDCLTQLAPCTEATREAFLTRRETCVAPLSSALSAGCMGSIAPPSPDLDGGPDSSLLPLDDGDAGVELFGVADEGRLALAWTSPRSPGAQWTVRLSEGGPFTELSAVADAAPQRFTALDGGASGRAFFVAALDAQGAVLEGEPFVSARAFDGGLACRVPVDCAPGLVCDLGACRAQSCRPGGDLTCPPGFACQPDTLCHRQFSVGAFDAGGFDAGALSPRPLVSNRVTLSSAAAAFQPDVPLGRFSSHLAAVAALDTARLFCAAEQEGLLLGHASSRRGRDFPTDEATAVLMDTVGHDVHLAFNADSQSLYACYTVGRAVRLQRSADEGRTWGVQATTLEPPADAGMASRVSDCELAPWKDGGVLLVTVEEDRLAVREVLPSLEVAGLAIAFRSTGPDGGQPYAPRHPALATASGSEVVHLTFTASRVIGPVDLEPYVVSSLGPTLSFSAPQSLAVFGTGGGSALPQDWTRVAIEPQSGRALAVFTTLEPGPLGSNGVADVYPVLYEPSPGTWTARTDLGVFAVDPRDGNTTLLLPAKQKNDRWNAFSPQLAVLADGRIFLSFVAGPLTLQGGDFRLYAARFDFDRLSPSGAAHGGFVSPAAQVSPTRVFDPRPLVGDLPPRLSSLAADAQLSLFSAVSEGTGAQGEVEGRALTNVRP